MAALGAAAVAAPDLRLMPAQQEQPAPCPALDRRGAFALRSFVANAMRRSLDIAPICGAVRIARGAEAPQAGQGRGAADSAIGRLSVKLPHESQR
ncbi:hypothetical protein MPC4_160114 [Methylocella tundrae]|uniref:Uncharacterized protein n=1 Tax=Methylocella tundrae TaxID=227605 RepID=A0A8B6M3V3_METTU|nr:hypothetical protein MPC4_160114 [Methylocella tundrae]